MKQHTDQLFQQYDLNNREKLRKCFRLPPIYIGDAKEYNNAALDSARAAADEQVFNPERMEFDNAMDRLILPYLDAKYHQFITNTPNPTKNDDLIRILGMAERAGALTPRISRDITAEILGRKLPDEFKEVDGDVPFSLQLALAAKKESPINASTAGGGPAASGATPAAPSTEPGAAPSNVAKEIVRKKVIDGTDILWKGIINVSDEKGFEIVANLLNVKATMESELKKRAQGLSENG